MPCYLSKGQRKLKLNVAEAAHISELPCCDRVLLQVQHELYLYLPWFENHDLLDIIYLHKNLDITNVFSKLNARLNAAKSFRRPKAKGGVLCYRVRVRSHDLFFLCESLDRE